MNERLIKFNPDTMTITDFAKLIDAIDLVDWDEQTKFDFRGFIKFYGLTDEQTVQLDSWIVKGVNE